MKIGRIESIIISVVFVICIAAVLYYVWKKYTLLEGFEDGGDKNYLDGVDAIYWINLDRSTDRRAKMEAMFRDPVFKGIDIIRVKAVDGKAPDIDNVLKENFEQIGTKQTKIEYACLLSHLNAIDKFSKSKYNTVLIMEDDCTLEYKKYWHKTINKLMNDAPIDCEIIQLCVMTNKIIDEDYIKINKDTQIFSCGAYLLTSKCKKKIENLKKNNKFQLNSNIPHVSDVLIYDFFNTYAYRYPYFTYTIDEKSTIHQEHVSWQNRVKYKYDKFMKTINL